MLRWTYSEPTETFPGVSPADRHLLGFLWDGNVYVDKVLPFGLRSAPLISAVADALLWIMHRRGVTWAIHCVDDFLTMGRPNLDECQSNMEIMHETDHTRDPRHIKESWEKEQIDRDRVMLCMGHVYAVLLFIHVVGRTMLYD